MYKFYLYINAVKFSIIVYICKITKYLNYRGKQKFSTDIFLIFISKIKYSFLKKKFLVILPVSFV